MPKRISRKDEGMDDLLQGMRPKDVAEKYKVSMSTVYKWHKEARENINPPIQVSDDDETPVETQYIYPPMPTKNKKEKFDIDYINKKLESGLTLKDIAKKKKYNFQDLQSYCLKATGAIVPEDIPLPPSSSSSSSSSSEDSD
jgi:uncharacterized protein YjcR